MNFSEQIAKSVVETILPSSEMQYQKNQSAGQYDFNLKYLDREVALEVTMAADEERLDTINAVTTDKTGGQLLEAVKCSKRWIIFPYPNAKINKIRALVDTHLAQIETEGLCKFFAAFDHPKSKAIKSLSDLGIESGYSYVDGKPEIFIELPGQWGLISPDHLQHVVESEAKKVITERSWGQVLKGKDIYLSTSTWTTFCHGKC